jgi:predicted O-linked N-acetylglucosamine transferase (SPINDLY family)
MPCLVPRWRSTLRLTEEEIFDRFVFVPRLEHRQYLKLVSLSSAFLNTFPFGAGVTSSEAIALCVPVIVYAETSSVLHIALAQVRALGEPWIARLLATSTQDFVNKAYGISQLESASNKSGLRHYRTELCQHNAALVGHKPLVEATQEWDRFLKRVSQ